MADWLFKFAKTTLQGFYRQLFLERANSHYGKKYGCNLSLLQVTSKPVNTNASFTCCKRKFIKCGGAHKRSLKYGRSHTPLERHWKPRKRIRKKQTAKKDNLHQSLKLGFQSLIKDANTSMSLKKPPPQPLAQPDAHRNRLGSESRKSALFGCGFKGNQKESNHLGGSFFGARL